MSKKAKATKTRNPQDSTRRNVQAANRKIADLTYRVRELEAWVHALRQAVAGIGRKLAR